MFNNAKSRRHRTSIYLLFNWALNQTELRLLGSQSRQSARLSLQSSESGPLTPSPAGECCPTLVCVGGGGARLRERWWTDAIRTRGQTLCVVLYCRYSITPLQLGLSSKPAIAKIIFQKGNAPSRQQECQFFHIFCFAARSCNWA
jgi:hypothetical protein